ncbi:Glu/Leu/Phe/Val dehydrogenase dimerization domain-containing protein [Streptomyces corynorhini]|uniref:Glu/Leu/Phe/Val dehydrogenase dimerization domain-containing protein n=1 Tax=Streptomyces corynorhini TaxID=2282652 RepID=UPI001F28C3F3|nr:Glu/Leu/Phe/Val dehydrogenase dimerization domain-containing protein [Streptomyces corynorhini]
MNRTPHLQLTWSDEQTGAQGYLVIDRLLRGVASGGLRMRPGCTLAEVGELARTMTLKESLVHQPGDRYLPFGGAKGGIDFDPSSPDAPGVLTRFLGAVSPLIHTYWAVGEDLGTRQEAIDAAVAAAGLRSCVEPALRHVPDGPAAGLRRIDDAFAVRVDGLGLGDTVGGYGVAQAVLATLAETDEEPVGLTAVVQGFGSMGGSAARYLARAGLRVVGVVDRDGVVADPDGLDVETLLAHRSPEGLVDRDRLPSGARPLPRGEWLSVASDVLVTAAASYAVDDANEGDVRCGYLVEAANVSVLPSAEKALLERGVIVVPDFLANFAANSWWWWTLFGDIGADAGEALAKIDKTMWRLVQDVFAEVRATGLSPREVATRLAERHHARFRGLPG